MTDRIPTLIPLEQLRHDPAPVAALYRDHGGQAARILRERLAAIALQIALTSEQLAERRLEGVPGQLRRVQRMAADLGLTSVSEVAGTCAAQTGEPPFPALWARLLRLTEAALHPSRDLLQASH